MSDETNESQNPRRVIGWVLAILLLLLLLIIATVFWWPANDSRLIKPFVPTKTAVPVTYDATFEPVSFPDLQSNPEQYRDQRIRVTGRYTRLAPPDCVSFDGPVIRWGLIAEELQMNAQGLESLLHLIPADTTLTVEGVWRRYQGPSGCGKAPEIASVWYLVVTRIVQPNPLPLPGLPPIDGGAVDGGTVSTMTATAVLDESAEPTPVVGEETAVSPTQLTATPTQLPTNTPQTGFTPTPVVTPTVLSTIPATASATPAAGNQPTATTGPTATITATPTETATPDPNASATPTNGAQPPIGVPTATSEIVPTSAYPAPETATPSSGYP